MGAEQVLQWAGALIGTMGLLIINGLRDELRKLNAQVTQLNVNLAVMTADHNNLDKRVQRLESKISD